MREKRVKAYRGGVLAETVAELPLRLKSHRIVARRYKTPVGEIDLVALKRRWLVFVEVKAQDDGGRGLDLAGQAAAAHRSFAGHPDFSGHDIAFDVVLTAPFAWPRYIANAFPV